MFPKIRKKIPQIIRQKNIIKMPKKALNPKQSLKIPQAILLTSKFLSNVSPKLMTKFAAKLFTSPIKHKIPKRELQMDAQSVQTKFKVPSIQKEINVYQYGKSDKKILLVHGWSGRGTQLFKIADALCKKGYETISFDAPAHGKSPGNATMMLDFIASILALEKKFGPFEAAIGHSLGGMSVANAISTGLQVKSAVLIGSGDIVQDILNDFVAKLKIDPIYSSKLCTYFESRLHDKMDDYSAYRAAQKIEIPVLVIHDTDDPEVSVKAGKNIYKNLKNGKLLITNGLGHRKILGDEAVITTTLEFIENNN